MVPILQQIRDLFKLRLNYTGNILIQSAAGLYFLTLLFDAVLFHKVRISVLHLLRCVFKLSVKLPYRTHVQSPLNAASRNRVRLYL